MPGSPCLSKKGESNVWFVPFKIFYLGGYLACPPVDGPKDPWPCVLSLPEWFVGDPVSLDSRSGRNVISIADDLGMKAQQCRLGEMEISQLWTKLRDSYSLLDWNVYSEL